MPRVSYSDTYTGARNKTFEAFYQYEHWDRDVADFLQHCQDKLTPKEKKYGAIIGFVVKAALDRKLEIVIHF